LETKIRLINDGDLDNLRHWKNAHKGAFFYKKIITIAQQKKWYEGYLERNKQGKDFMFIVEVDGVPIGCYGYRFIGWLIDIYNTILGNKKYEGKKIISTVCKDLWKYLRDTYYVDITVRVLSTNKPTIDWYLKNNWISLGTFNDHVVLEYEG